MDNLKSTDEELVAHIRTSIKSQGIELIAFMANILPRAGTKDAPLILGAILGAIQQTDFTLPRHLESSFWFYVEQMAHSSGQWVAPPLKEHLLTHVARQTAQGIRDTAGQDILEMFRQLVVEALVKRSRGEIANATRGESGESSSDGAGLGAALVHCLKNASLADVPQAIKLIASFITEERLPALLGFFCECPVYAEDFFIALRCLNEDVYENAADLIYTEKRFFKRNLVGALPVLDMDQIIPGLRDYNWEVVEDIVATRPHVAGALARAFRSGALKISRRGFLEKVIEFDGVFAEYILEMELTEEEATELAGKSLLLAEKLFSVFSTDQMMGVFVGLVVEKKKEAILQLIKSCEDEPNFVMFMRLLLENTRLEGELRDYVVDRFAGNKVYFPFLIVYLDLDQIEHFLQDIYEPRRSIEVLLKKYHPQELIIEIHRFKDIELAKKLVTECVSMGSFNDRDWALAMRSLEGITSPVKMCACLFLLETRPQLRGQVILLLKHSLNSTLWSPSFGFGEFIRSLEALGEECMKVMEVMSREEADYCLEKSPIVRDNLMQFFKKAGGRLSQRQRMIKGLINAD